MFTSISSGAIESEYYLEYIEFVLIGLRLNSKSIFFSGIFSKPNYYSNNYLTYSHLNLPVSNVLIKFFDLYFNSFFTKLLYNSPNFITQDFFGNYFYKEANPKSIKVNFSSLLNSLKILKSLSLIYLSLNA